MLCRPRQSLQLGCHKLSDTQQAHNFTCFMKPPLLVSCFKLQNLYWIIGRKSQLSVENKLLVYKVILKPVWIYGIQLWGTASNSNLEILERFQSKVLCIITDAPWYIPNNIIKSDLQIWTVKKEARKYSANYRKQLDAHPNNLANALFKEQLGNRRLKRLYPADLVTNG
jgi:hypothetical protein